MDSIPNQKLILILFQLRTLVTLSGCTIFYFYAFLECKYILSLILYLYIFFIAF